MLVCPLIMSMSAGRCGGWNLPFFVGERNVSAFVLQIAVSWLLYQQFEMIVGMYSLSVFVFQSNYPV